uniref:Protein SCAI n=1 Tax=Macrostomum lignano TaxID=282301 RepID=A0A1I8HEB9_9PLAT
DLPQYGHKQWQSHFGRAFDVYTKLWKFQQQHRQLLDGGYGLKRWQIGEIASKIGQLYYHYYLRTSETNYLNESFAFYSAIRLRAYYSKANKEERPDLMVKKLRYYARFVIVCLLLKKLPLVRELIRELARQIEDYTGIYQPADAAEWAQVLQEIRAFIAADSVVSVLDQDSMPVVLSNRLSPAAAAATSALSTTTAAAASSSSGLRLAEVVLVGNCAEQAKFSELTLDMFRMLQTLEREPQSQQQQQQQQQQHHPHHQYSTDAAGIVASGFDSPLGAVAGGVVSASGHRLYKQHSNGSEYGRGGSAVVRQQLQLVGGSSASASSRRENPHKYLLYKPSLAQLNAFLASGFKELPADGVLMLYLSADGDRGAPSKLADDFGFAEGGVLTNSRRDSDQSQLPPRQKRSQNSARYKNPHCSAFGNFPNLFGQPFVCLMSPELVPSNVVDQRHKGSLFTLFLHSPLAAFCLICNVQSLPLALWDRGQAIVDRFLAEAGRLMMRSRQIDAAYLQYYRDDFLRLLVLRYLFCSACLRLHRSFRGPRYYPASLPPLPEQLLLEGGVVSGSAGGGGAVGLQRLVLDLANLMNARAAFSYGPAA